MSVTGLGCVKTLWSAIATAQTFLRESCYAEADLEAAGDGQQSPRLVWAHHLRDLLRLTEVIDRGLVAG